MMDEHLAYWYLGTYPLMPSIAHPSTIGKDYLLQILYGPSWSSSREMRRLLELDPELIVKQENPFYLEDQPKTVELLKTALEQNYTFIHDVEGLEIYAKDLSAHDDEW